MTHLGHHDIAPPATSVPGPVGLMMARQLHAALMHIATWNQLAKANGAIPQTDGLDDQPHPAAATHDAAHKLLWLLRQWTDHTALASGAIATLPDYIGGDPGSAATAAHQTLYPAAPGDPGRRWCSQPGGRLPQPGDRHNATPSPSDDGVTHLLTGSVPDWQLVATRDGIAVRKARDVVPGTPAHAIWQAHESLSAYACDWMYRRGDSPADLAAALDGLTELAQTFAAVSGQVLGELSRRFSRGTLTGGDRAALRQAAEELEQLLSWPRDGGGTSNPLAGALVDARSALTGATAAPAPAPARPVPATLAREMSGRTDAEIREELGGEVFYQRQVCKTRPPSWDRADALTAILTWMHATGASTYDAAAHAAAHPAVAALPAPVPDRALALPSADGEVKTMTCKECWRHQVVKRQVRQFTEDGPLIWLYQCPGCETEYAARLQEGDTVDGTIHAPTVARIMPDGSEDTELGGWVVDVALDLLAANTARDEHGQRTVLWARG